MTGRPLPKEVRPTGRQPQRESARRPVETVSTTSDVTDEPNHNSKPQSSRRVRARPVRISVFINVGSRSAMVAFKPIAPRIASARRAVTRATAAYETPSVEYAGAVRSEQYYMFPMIVNSPASTGISGSMKEQKSRSPTKSVGMTSTLKRSGPPSTSRIATTSNSGV